MIDQIFEKRVFLLDHSAEVQKLADELSQSIIKLNANGYFDVMPEKAKLEVISKFENRNWDDFFSHLRQHAVCFNGKSNNFWCIIDATGSLLDAIGAHWKYMTQSNRLNRLAHGHAHLSELN